VAAVGLHSRKSGKAAGKVVPGPSHVKPTAGEATDIFIALLEAERWLFSAGEGADADPETAAAIEDIRRQVCRRLERLQARAYREFDGRLGVE
jgi:hypothetical protein